MVRAHAPVVPVARAALVVLVHLVQVLQVLRGVGVVALRLSGSAVLLQHLQYWPQVVAAVVAELPEVQAIRLPAVREQVVVVPVVPVVTRQVGPDRGLNLPGALAAAAAAVVHF